MRASENGVALGGPGLSAQEYGRDGPPLVLLHGLGGAGSMWVPVAERLAGRRRILIPDLLGFGHSPWPDAEYSVDDHLAALQAMLAERGLSRGPLDIAGHSMGAILAAELAARNPERVRGLVLVSLPYFRSEAEARDHVARMGTLARLTVAGHPLAKAVCRGMCALRPALRFLTPRVAPHVPADVARDALMHDFTSYSRSLRSVIVDHRPDAALRKLAGRSVLLIHGDADRSAPLENLRTLAQSVPGWVLEVVAGGGHYLPLERPGRVAQLLDVDRSRCPRAQRPERLRTT